MLKQCIPCKKKYLTEVDMTHCSECGKSLTFQESAVTPHAKKGGTRTELTESQRNSQTRLAKAFVGLGLSAEEATLAAKKGEK
jgi:hypothetical protein